MPIEGKLEPKNVLRLRVFMLKGKLGDIEFQVCHNIDGKVIFVEIGGKKVSYYVEDMVRDAYELIEKEEKVRVEEA